MTGKSSAIHFFAVIMTFLGLAVSCSPEWKDEMIPGVSVPEHQEKQFDKFGVAIYDKQYC